MKRFLALDIGKKRTGVALVDDSVRVATPIEVIHNEPTSQDFLEVLQNLISEWEPCALIFGLPIDLKGREAIAAKQVREIANSIINRVNEIRKNQSENPLESFFVDERMTTAQVERQMIQAGISADVRKKLRDALAATVIAQTYIDTL